MVYKTVALYFLLRSQVLAFHIIAKTNRCCSSCLVLLFRLDWTDKSLIDAVFGAQSSPARQPAQRISAASNPQLNKSPRKSTGAAEPNLVDLLMNIPKVMKLCKSSFLDTGIIRIEFH